MLRVNLGSKEGAGSTKAAVKSVEHARKAVARLWPIARVFNPSTLGFIRLSNPPLPFWASSFLKGPDATMRRLDGRDVTLNGYT